MEKNYEPRYRRIAVGSLDAVLGTLLGVRTVLDGVVGYPISTVGEALGAASMGYEVYKDFTEGVYARRSLLIATAGLGAAGIEKIVYAISEEKPIYVADGILDLALSGVTFARYLVLRLWDKRDGQINQNLRRGIEDNSDSESFYIRLQ